MKVGLFSPYLDTLGGGERYIFTVAEFFLNRGDSVDFFETSGVESLQIKERFNIDLTKASFLDKPKNTIGYDLFFFLSDGSVPFSFANKNLLHFQVPFKLENQKTIANKIKLSRFKYIICNSVFTKKFVDQTYGINSEVIYPPIDVESFKAGKKENIILSVGRFFAPGHPKKQEIMIKVFREMNLKGWQLILIGGVTLDNNEEVENLRKMAGDANIKIITDSSFKTLKTYYSRAKIYWHAAGFGEDLEAYPEKAEHFGMSTVEAMAAGCVPVVFNGGGQPEIINSEECGFLWQTTDDLIEITEKLAKDESLLKKMSRSAIDRSENFNKKAFFDSLEKMVNTYA